MFFKDFRGLASLLRRLDRGRGPDLLCNAAFFGAPPSGGRKFRPFPMTESPSPDPLKDLDARLRQARSAGQPPEGPGPALKGPLTGFGMAFRVGTEMVAALVVGVGIGLLLDRWLGTAPWFLVVFFFLGAGAGVLNVYRAASGLGMAPGYQRPGDDLGEGPPEGGGRSS